MPAPACAGKARSTNARRTSSRRIERGRLSRPNTIRNDGDPEAPGGEPRRDRRAHLPHLPRARNRDGCRCRARRRRGTPRPRGRRDRVDRELPPLRGAHPCGGRVGRGRDPSRLRLPRRERGLRRRRRRRRPDVGRPAGGGAAARRRQAGGEADRGRGGRPGRAHRRACRARLSAPRQGRGGRRRARDARRAHAGRARRGAGGGRARGRGGVRGRHGLLRAVRRAAAPRRDPAPGRRPRDRDLARRARLLRAAPPPEGAGGVALSRARPGAAGGDECRGDRLRERDRLPERRHGRVHARRPRVLVPGAERPDPGRASGHRARHRRRPRARAAPGRARRATSCF